MKGLVFTIDALIALSIIISVISGLIFFRTKIASPYLASQQLHFISEDVLTVLSNSKLKDAVDNKTLLEEYVSRGILNQKNLDEKTIDIIGSLWSAGNISEAANITKDVLNNFIPSNIGYEFLIDDDSIYNSSDTSRPSYDNSTIEISSGRVVSGYEKYKPTEGYVARAIARRISKNNTLIVMGDVVTSSVCRDTNQDGTKCTGNNNNEVNISYIVDIPEDATILDAYWYIEAVSTDNQIKAYINGKFIGGSPASGGKATLDRAKVMPELHPGHNIGIAVFSFQRGSLVGGDNGASHFVVTYNTSNLSTLEDFSKQRFQTIYSNCSFEYKKPVFVPGDISNISVRLNITNNTQVNNLTMMFMWNGVRYLMGNKTPSSGIAEWSDAEIKNILNSNGIYYNMLKSKFFWFIVYVDTYHFVEPLGYGRVINGNDSYVSINYSRPGQVYNYIDLTRTLSNYTYEDLDTYFTLSDFYRYIRWNFNLTHKIPLLARWQFAWGYQDGLNPKQLARANNITLYNHDPNNATSDPFIKEFVRFGYSTEPLNILISSDNKFELNFTNGYSINPLGSLGESTFLVPASVGYGDVFPNETSATNDAIQRLQDILGDDISAMEMVVDSVRVAGVPYMWGPVSARIRTWV